MRGVDRDRDMGGTCLTPAGEYEIAGLNLVAGNLASDGPLVIHCARQRQLAIGALENRVAGQP